MVFLILRGDVYFASSDTHPDFPFKKGFDFSDLTKVINVYSASIVAILDCCYSGAAELHKGNQDDVVLVGTSQIDKMSQIVNENEGKYILCAGQKYETSVEGAILATSSTTELVMAINKTISA
jgi:hypothetical protein